MGILNAAVWCGSAIFLALGLPAVFSPELKKLLTPAGVGFAAEAVVARFFLLQYWCGVVALTHQVTEWLYCGRPLRRGSVALVLGMLLVSLAGGLWLQPKMRAWHATKYFGKTAALQTEAAQSFAVWHAVSESANLVVIAGLVYYLWRVTLPADGPRLGGFGKIRG